jgi:hypothetical protein
VCKALNGEYEGAAPENAIFIFNDRHEFCLPVVLMERRLAEEIRLHEVERRDPAQDNAGFVVVVVFAIDGENSIVTPKKYMLVP